MQEINKRALVDMLSEQLNSNIVKSGDNYVYLETKEIVAQIDVETALEVQNAEFLKLSIDKKITEIKQAFSDELKQGFTTISGIKMDATYSDMSFFKDGIEFCEDMGLDVDVRDFNNVNHTKTVIEARAILDEIKANYHNLRTKKNKSVDLANNYEKPNE